jgi:hypothetical protein
MTSGVTNPQFVTGWTNQQDYSPLAYLDTDLSGINQGTVTKADLVTATQTTLTHADTAYSAVTSTQTEGLGEYYLDGAPTGTFRKTMARRQATIDTSALTTQVMLSTAIVLYAGDVVTNLTFVSGATAANTPTNWWFALYSNAATPALIAQTADQTTTAWGANTVMTKALSAPYTVVTTGVYYAAIMVKATTPPSIVGKTVNVNTSGVVLTGQKVLAQTSGATLTTTAPATIATPTTVVNHAFCIAN